MELIWSASLRDLDEILRLEAEGVSLDVADYDGRTPLHLAASEGQAEIIRHLISSKVNLNSRDRWGNPPLDDTIKFKNSDIQKQLERAFKNQNRADEK